MGVDGEAEVGGHVVADLTAGLPQEHCYLNVDAPEAEHPVLRGTIRDHTTRRRRPFVRSCAEQRDLSHDDPDAPLPAAVTEGRSPFHVVGAVAGG